MIELIKRSFASGMIILLLTALMTPPAHTDDMLTMIAPITESIQPVSPADVDFTMTNPFPDETSDLAPIQEDTLLESSSDPDSEDSPAPIPILEAQAPIQEPDAGMNGTTVLNRYIEMGLLKEIPIAIPDLSTGETIIRTFRLNLGEDSGTITEIFKDGTVADNGTFSKLPLPEGTSNIYDYLIVMEIQEENFLQKPTVIITLHDNRDNRYDFVVPLFMKVGRHGIALPEFYDVGFGFLFDPMYEDAFFENDSSASYLSAMISLILDFTLPFDNGSIVRTATVEPWLDTFEDIPDFEEQFQESFSQHLWDQYRSLAIVAGNYNVQLHNIAEVLHLNPDQEAIFREHRMLVIQDSVADFEDGDINNIHKWIANYPMDILYRSGIITPDTWIADDPNEDIIDHSGIITPGTWITDTIDSSGITTADTTTSTVAAYTSYLTGDYMHISIEKGFEDFNCVQKFVLDHELGHWVDLGNWNMGLSYSGTRPQLLNQTGIRSRLYETATEQETLIRGLPISTDEEGNPIPITDPEGNSITYNSEINFKENTAEEWAWGIMADTDGRLYELIANAATQREFAGLRSYMTLLSITAVNSPTIVDENEETVYQVPIYQGTDFIGSTQDRLIHSNNTVIGYLPVHMDSEYNITKIEAPDPDSEIFFPHPEVTFEYAPFNPDYPENNMFRISSMSLSYDGTHYPEYAGVVCTIYNPLVEDKPSVCSNPQIALLLMNRLSRN